MRIKEQLLIAAGLLFTMAAAAQKAGKPGGRAALLLAELNKPESKYVMVVAHRGDFRHEPENSFEGFVSAANSGVDIVEVDLQKTKDNVLVLMHNETIDAKTNGSGKISDFTFEELQQFNLKGLDGKLTTRKIPTLGSVLLKAKELGTVLVNLDKSTPLFPEIGALLDSTRTNDLVIVKSNWLPGELKERLPYLHGAPFMPVLHVNKIPDPVKRIRELVDTCHPKVMEVSFQSDTSRLFSDPAILTRLGVKIWYSCMEAYWCGGHNDQKAVHDRKEEETWGWLLNKGGTVLMTNYPEELIRYLEKKHRRNLPGLEVKH